MTKTSPDCDATVLSTSQPNRMGTTAEMQKMYDEFGGERKALLRAQDVLRRYMKREPDATVRTSANQVLHEIKAALAATPAVGGLEKKWADIFQSIDIEDDVALISMTPSERNELVAVLAPVVGGMPLGWLHQIEEPGRDLQKMYSASPDNPWGHWVNEHKDKCRYTATPLYAAQPASHQTTPPIEGSMNREEIARIIDPVAWANFDHVKKHGATPASENSITKPSLEIADKILSASPPEQPAADPVTGRDDVIEECAKMAEVQKEAFLAPEYASNQPFGSFCERFACDEVANAIRALKSETQP